MKPPINDPASAAKAEKYCEFIVASSSATGQVLRRHSFQHQMGQPLFAARSAVATADTWGGCFCSVGPAWGFSPRRICDIRSTITTSAGTRKIAKAVEKNMPVMV